MPECRQCGDYFEPVDGWGDDTFCSENCMDYHYGSVDPFDEDGGVNTILHGYHNIDVARLHGFGDPERSKFGTEYHIGIELEFATNDEFGSAQGIHQYVKDWGVIMRDGSIGIEVISKPMNFRDIKKSFAPLFRQKLRSQHNMRVTAGAGLHVNISRSAFTNDAALANFILFVNNHEKAMVKIAGRGAKQWGQWARVKKHTRDEADEKVKNGSDKYQAVRIGHDRVEVRIFKSTSTLKTLLSRVRFCMALIDYSNYIQRTGKYPLLSDFANFIKGTRHEKFLTLENIAQSCPDDDPIIAEDNDYSDINRCSTYGTPWLNVSL